MGVSYGHSRMIRLMTCASHGERVCAEYLVYRMILIVLFFRYLVSACHYMTKFAAVHYVLLTHAFYIKLIRAVANYGIRYGRHNSFLGHNALICSHRYNINVNDIIADSVINAKCIINSYFNELVEDSHYYTSCFVRELLLLRDNALVLSNNVVLSFDDLEQLIKVVCTC